MKNEEYSHTFFACLFVLDLSLDRSEKNLELDLILFIFRSSRKTQAKQLHTPGESTLSPGETTPGEHDIGRNDLLPNRSNVGG